MTDLLTRSPSASTRNQAPAGRPLTVSAALAGLFAAGSGLVVCLAVAVTGWFLADGGAHGDTRDALRVGADAWLVGHGSHLTYGGVTYTVVPLGLTVLLAWVAFRAGRWAGATSPPADDRELWVGAMLMTSAYVVVAIVTCVVAATPEVSGSLVLTLLGSITLAGGVGGCGLVTGAGRWPVVRALLPPWAWPVVRSALAIVVGLLACSALVVVAAFALDAGSAATVVSRLGLHTGDALMLVLLTALVAPNAVLLGGAYVLGPGFAVGTGTMVSPSVVQLGPVPAFPLLAALPDDGATPWFTTALMGVPVLVAAVSVALVQRRPPVRAWDLAAIRGLGSGVIAGVVTGILTSFAGGALGDGRMADLGASTGVVLVASMLAMGTGGLIGALVTTYLQRREPVADGDDTEATVEVPLARTSARRTPPRVHEVREVPDDQEDTVEVRLDGD
jgi:hypothetical protein